MRILILHSRYRSGSVSGENRVVDDEARLLSDAGHEVEMFAPGVGDPSGVELLRTGARVVWSRRAAAEVRHRVQRLRPEIVHCHNLFPALSPAVLRGIGGRAALVMTLHNYRLHCLPGVFFRDGRICEDCRGRRVAWPGVLHACYQGSVAASLALGTSLALHGALDTFGRVDLFLAISDFVRQKHIQGGLSPERILVKPHFVWPQERRQGPGRHYLFLGRLSPEKGAGTILKAWRSVDAKLIVAGDGPQATYLRSIAPPNVEFTSSVSPARAGELVRSARAVLVPSVAFEGAGRVVLEASASAVPVLASEIGALPEAIEDGVTGRLLPPGDPASWAAAVRALVDDHESERMGRAALQLWSERYSPEQGLARLEEAYSAALERGSRR